MADSTDRIQVILPAGGGAILDRLCERERLPRRYVLDKIIRAAWAGTLNPVNSAPSAKPAVPAGKKPKFPPYLYHPTDDPNRTDWYVRAQYTPSSMWSGNPPPESCWKWFRADVVVGATGRPVTIKPRIHDIAPLASVEFKEYGTACDFTFEQTSYIWAKWRAGEVMEFDDLADALRQAELDARRHTWRTMEQVASTPEVITDSHELLVKEWSSMAPAKVAPVWDDDL